MKRTLILLISHAAAVAIGFAAGVYALPILIAPDGPATSTVQSLQGQSQFEGEFRRGLKGSDLLHWGEGTVSLNGKVISLAGKLAPGPDYRLYLVPGLADSKEAFLKVKADSLQVGEIKTFENFIVPLAADVDLARYNTVLVWCETFSMFITAAKYR